MENGTKPQLMLPVIVQRKDGVDYTDNNQTSGLILLPNVIAIDSEGLNLTTDATEYIAKNPSTYRSTPYYNSQAYGYNNTYNNKRELKDDRTIYFYEFSDLTSVPKVFKSVSAFDEWAKTCKIYISTYLLDDLKASDISYCCCYKTSSTLMVKSSYSALKEYFERIYPSTPRHSYQPSGCYNPMNHPYYDDYYSDWD